MKWPVSPRSWISLTLAAFSTVFLAAVLVEHYEIGLFRGSPSYRNALVATNAADVSQKTSAIHLDNSIHRDRPPKILEFSWNITKAPRRPDGVAKDVYLVNEQFPGPTVECRSGDTVMIQVSNLLDDEDTAIHWHGLRIENAMDGVPGLTQQAIRSGDVFTYVLNVSSDQAGTFWYHGHSGTQRADGLYGAFIVHGPHDGHGEGRLNEYSDEQVLLIGDWYHRSGTEVLDYYDDWKNFKVEPAPDSMLLNGEGRFDCAMAVPARPVDCQERLPPSFPFHGTRTRLRIINTGSLTGLRLDCAGCKFEPLEVDGGSRVERFPSPVTAIGNLYPGERIDVIVQREEPETLNMSLVVSLDSENLRFRNFALRPSQRFELQELHPATDVDHESDASFPMAGPASPDLDLLTLNATQSVENTLPETVDKVLLLYTNMLYLAEYENRPKGFINGTSWNPDAANSVLALQDASYAVAVGSWIEIVVNNFDDKGHPFHLHGLPFYVLSIYQPVRPGLYDAYNPFDADQPPAGGPMNLLTPLKKDTVYVPSMGYVVLRLEAKVAGRWMFHCHLLWHSAVGMNAVLEVS